MRYSARSVRERRQLITSGEHTLVVLFNDDYEMFRQQIALADVRSPSSENPAWAGSQVPQSEGALRTSDSLALSEDVLLLTLGPFEACALTAIAAGGTGR